MTRRPGDGRHRAGSVNHGANMPAHGSSARSASAVSGKRSRICCLCSMITALASLHPSTSATNIEAGLRDRVRELRDRGMSWVRIGAALDMMWQSA